MCDGVDFDSSQAVEGNKLRRVDLSVDRCGTKLTDVKRLRSESPKHIVQRKRVFAFFILKELKFNLLIQYSHYGPIF